MSGLTRWWDTTTYRQGDKERKPRTYTIKHGFLNVTIVSGHRDYPGEWVLHCFAVGIDTKPINILNDVYQSVTATTEDDLDIVKARAIEIVEARIDEIRDDIIAIKRVSDNATR